MSRFLRSFATIALTGLALSVHAGPINLLGGPNAGSQSAADTLISGTNAVGSSATFSGTGTLGGGRDLFVIKTGGADSATDGISASVSNGVFDFASTSGHAGAAVLRWDGASNTGFGQSTASSIFSNLNNAIGSINGGGLVSADFSAAMGSAFVFDVLSASAGFNFTLQVFSGSGTQYSNLTVTSLAGPGVYVVPFAAFSGIPALQCAGGVAAGCANFSSVSAFQMIVNYPGAAVEGINLQMRVGTDERNSVPEPGTLALAGAALLAAVVPARRRRAASQDH